MTRDEYWAQRRCSQCLFYSPCIVRDLLADTVKVSPSGECRKNPPALVKGRKLSNFPLVSQDDYCGSHHPSENPEA